MLAMVSLIFPPLRRPICCSRSPVVVCSLCFLNEGSQTDHQLDLVTYCENEEVVFTTFNDFSDIHNTVKEIVAGKLTVKEAATGRN